MGYIYVIYIYTLYIYISNVYIYIYIYTQWVGNPGRHASITFHGPGPRQLDSGPSTWVRTGAQAPWAQA